MLSWGAYAKTTILFTMVIRLTTTAPICKMRGLWKIIKKRCLNLRNISQQAIIIAPVSGQDIRGTTW